MSCCKYLKKLKLDLHTAKTTYHTTKKTTLVILLV